MIEFAYNLIKILWNSAIMEHLIDQENRVAASFGGRRAVKAADMPARVEQGRPVLGEISQNAMMTRRQQMVKSSKPQV